MGIVFVNDVFLKDKSFVNDRENLINKWIADPSDKFKKLVFLNEPKK